MAGGALVLGGGGVTGVAWELGMIAGLAEAGVDLTTAVLIVGTSAGSVVGAQIASGTALEELYARQLAGYGSEVPARLGVGTLLNLAWIALTSRDAARARVRMGAIALAAITGPESERRTVIASRLPSERWPDRDLVVTAIDALSGEFVRFDRNSGVSMVDAIAASCAVPGVWPPATVDGRRYIDGGMRSPVNADLAAGHDRVVVLAPVTASFPRSPSLTDQVAELRKTAKVALVSPDRTALKAIGRNVLDPSRRAPAARAGRRQAADVATSVAGVWAT